MQKTKKHFLSTLTALLIVITIIPSMAFTRPARADVTDVDVDGYPIDDMIDRFAIEWKRIFPLYDKQESTTGDTIVFIDSQLLEFDFMDRLCAVFYEDYTPAGLADIYENYGYIFLVHQQDFVYANVTGNQIIDFSIEENRNVFASYIANGYYSMCALGIWRFETPVDMWLRLLQSNWKYYGYDMPIYVIEREPFTGGPDALEMIHFSGLYECFVTADEEQII